MKRMRMGLLVLLVVIGMMSQAAFAEGEGNPTEGDRASTAKRTILLYDCGADLETDAAMATYNLEQILKAHFSEDEDIRFIVMTGGSEQWQLDKSYLVDPEADEAHQPDEISNEYNQIWEAKGLDADEHAGKMVLLDRGGLSGDGAAAKMSKDELMSDPETLKAFINYGVEHFPAEKYDLILWDHGGGPLDGFAVDQHEEVAESIFAEHSLMSFSKILDALTDNKVVDADGDHQADGKFDFVDFDACLMNSVELDLALADCTDYYIASPETEPGYGQYYTGWLDMLGEAQDHEVGTFELGKKIVDDFYDFYDHGDGQGQDGTLAVIDMNKMTAPETGFIDALNELNGALADQVRQPFSGEIVFYDEFNSFRNSIKYGDLNYYDLGNMASFISVVNMEVTHSDVNAYWEIGPKITELLQPDGENAFIYARGTEGISTDYQLFRKADGDLEYDKQGTSGMFLYFPGSAGGDCLQYNEEVDAALKLMPDGAAKEFLDNYRRTVIDYALILMSGSEVNYLINNGMAKEDIDYTDVKASWQDGMDDPLIGQYCSWNMMIKPLIDMREGGEEKTDQWLEGIVEQQADEAISADNITAKKIKSKDGDGYEITINGAKKRVIEGVSWRANLELPVFEEYIAQNIDPDLQNIVRSFGDLSMGSASGYEDLSDMPDPSEPYYQEKLIEWYNKTTNVWTLNEAGGKWYVIKDANGVEHVTGFEKEGEGTGIVPATVGVGYNNQLLLLYFEDDALTEVWFLDPNTGWRPVPVKELTGELEVMTIDYVSIFGLLHFFVPISRSTFTLSADNADSIKLVQQDIDKIDEIGDVDGDGKAVNFSASVYDFYEAGIDITDKLENPEEELIDIGYARVQPGIYNGGQPLSPVVVYRDTVLEEGTDYTWETEYDGVQCDDLGDYEIVLTGMGKYRGVAGKTFHVIMSEEAAKTAIEEAEAELRAAQDAVAALADDASANEIKAAYNRVITAQYALADAQQELARTENILSQDEQEQLQEQIDQLEEDLAELTRELAKATMVDISNFAVTMKTSFQYTGDYIEPEVRVKGLTPGDYTVEYDNNLKIGTATAIITGVSSRKFKGTITVPFKITKKTNTLKAAGKTAKVKFKKLRKKKQKLSVAKVITFNSKGQGTLSYKKVSGSKKITINTKTGKVTVKKGLKKGTYKVKVTITARGSSIYASAAKSVTFKVKVK